MILGKLFENAHVDLPEAKENFDAVMKLVNEKPYMAIFDARTTVTVTKEAMEFGAKPEQCRLLIAHAIIINSLPNRILGNFIIKFHKPSAPTKLFSNIEPARTWLKEKLREKEKYAGKKKTTR
ncbi:MAG TPA: hypothetical protein VNX68_02145 [Nitrosopumilaceae archaeon]|nr:hypothetical protein [Nitrosopumilaceae archaeon]